MILRISKIKSAKSSKVRFLGAVSVLDLILYTLISRIFLEVCSCSMIWANVRMVLVPDDIPAPSHGEVLEVKEGGKAELDICEFVLNFNFV